MPSQILDALRLPWPTHWDQICSHRSAPIVEVGFGNARYLLHLAKRNPESNVIGIEISNHALDKAAEKTQKARINNVCLIRARAFMFFWLVVPAASLQSIHINFPDPWPKAAHKNRRLLNMKFLDLVAARLESGGMIQIATDDAEYASSIEANLRESVYFDEETDVASRRTTLPDIQTKYEIKAVEAGRLCHYLVWRRNHTAVVDALPVLQELTMPHVIISTPLPLMEIGQLYEPLEYSEGQISVRFVDFFQSVRYDQAVVDTYVSEGELEQRVLLNIKGKGSNRYLISMRETGFPRPTPATHVAIQQLAEIIVSMHARAKIENHNLKQGYDLEQQ